jgi:MFS family permease
MWGGALSMLIDTYDIYLPAFVLPAAMGYFEPASLPATVKVTLISLMVAITLIGRPLGGAILGNLSDKVGRRRITLVATWGFTICTLILAIMPGYAQWGYGAIVLFFLLRFVDGGFLGGGYAGAVPLAMERSPVGLRGFLSGLVGVTNALALVLVSVVQLVVLSLMSKGAFATWGWRLPFLFGVILGIAFIGFYSSVPEQEMSYLSKESGAAKQPIWELFTKTNGKKFGQLFLLISGFWFVLYTAGVFLPSLLIGILHEPAKSVSLLEIIVQFGTMATALIAGVLSQKIGRRPMFMWAGGWILVILAPVYYLIIKNAQGGAGFGTVAVLAFIAVAFSVGPALGLIFSYLNECFPTRIRSTGYSVVYSFGLIIPSFFSIYLVWLSRLVPYAYTVVILFGLGGLLVLLGSWLGPETRDVNLLG